MHSPMSDNQTPSLAVARLASDYWRMLRQFERALAYVPEDRRNRFAAQVKYQAQRLEIFNADNGYRVVSHDGVTFQEGLPVSIVNEDEISGDGPFVIQDTIEPTVLQDGKVLLMGRVILKESS